jgi:ribosomal protein S18 acetylase RimI-like enzyme
MERDLSGPVPEPLPPDGIAIRAYRHDVDLRPVFETLEEAFRDHWGYEPYPWDRHVEEMSRQDPELVGIALDRERVVGVVLARTAEGRGWVDVLGVRPSWRGRGIARTLLLRSFGTLRERGASWVMLNVDSANRSGATRLYESVGMHVRRAFQVFERPLAAT